MTEFWQMTLWILEVFILYAWILVMFNVISDLFRDQDLGGFAKAIWIVLLIFIPFLTAIVYVLARGKGMAERSVAAHAMAKENADAYIREVAGSSPASQIAEAKQLLDSGAITQEEFAALKARALA